MDNITNKFRTLSLFSGIGGLDIGLSRWCETVCYVELGSHAQATICKNMAAGNIDTAPIWDDVTTFGRNELEAVGPIDAIAGGFPCQDISCAGKGAGIEGERSGLFFEIIRLVRLVRPKIIFLENVPAILNRGLDRVLGDLAEVGYDAEWHCIPASHIGAPHRRDRWWCVAYPDSWRCTPFKHPGSGKEKNCGGQSNLGSGSEDVADTTKQCRGRQKRLRKMSIGRSGRSWWSIEPDVGRVAHGIPFRMDRLKSLGNAVVPQCAEAAFELLFNEVEA